MFVQTYTRIRRGIHTNIQWHAYLHVQYTGNVTNLRQMGYVLRGHTVTVIVTGLSSSAGGGVHAIELTRGLISDMARLKSATVTSGMPCCPWQPRRAFGAQAYQSSGPATGHGEMSCDQIWSEKEKKRAIPNRTRIRFGIALFSILEHASTSSHSSKVYNACGLKPGI